MSNINAERIDSLRSQMRAAGIDVYYIPMSDCHNSEYVAAHFRCVEFISGFTGSAGSVVVTQEGAWLFADGRYFIQAAQQIEGSGITLMKIGEPGVPELKDFLRDQSRGKVLGFDGRVVSLSDYEKYQTIAEKKKGRIVDRNLLTGLWKDRPALPKKPVWVLEPPYAGCSMKKKLSMVYAAMEAQGAD